MCVVLNVGGGKSKGRTKTHTRWKFEAEVTAVVVCPASVTWTLIDFC